MIKTYSKNYFSNISLTNIIYDREYNTHFEKHSFLFNKKIKFLLLLRYNIYSNFKRWRILQNQNDLQLNNNIFFGSIPNNLVSICRAASNNPEVVPTLSISSEHFKGVVFPFWSHDDNLGWFMLRQIALGS